MKNDVEWTEQSAYNISQDNILPHIYIVYYTAINFSITTFGLLNLKKKIKLYLFDMQLYNILL